MTINITTTALRLGVVIAIAASFLTPVLAQKFGSREWLDKYKTVESVDARLHEIDAQLADLDRQLTAGHEAAVRAITAAQTVAELAASRKLTEANRALSLQYDLLSIERKGTLEYKHQVEATPACAALYASTIDKKQSDLTVRETDTIKECKKMDIYNAEKAKG